MRSRKYVYCKVYAIEYDGQPLYKMMEDTGFTAEGCKLYVESEGGNIDDKSIIHRGSAVNKELEELKKFKAMQSEWESKVEHDRLIIEGLAKDDNGFCLTKEEQIKAGLRKGKGWEPPVHKFNPFSGMEEQIDAEIICKKSKSIMEMMFKCYEANITATAQYCISMVRSLRGSVDDNGNIIW